MLFQVEDLKVEIEMRILSTVGLTNSVYLPRRDAGKGARTQRRQIKLVGLNRNPDHILVSGIGVCKLGVL